MKPTIRLIVTDNGSLQAIIPKVCQNILEDGATVTDRYGNVVFVSSSVSLAALVANADARDVTIVEYIDSLQRANEVDEPEEVKLTEKKEGT